jgi:AraC-like DNA-binding protein
MIRQMMSLMRHSPMAPPSERRPPDLAVRGYAVTHPSGTVVLPTEPGWDQLLYASAGVMSVVTEAGIWVIPPHRALWAPAGADHRIVMHGRVSVRTLYLRQRLAVLPAAWRAVNVTPLLRELILHAVRSSPLDLQRPDHERLIGVIVDLLRTLPQVPLQLPMPLDPRAAALAHAIAGDPGGTESVTELACSAGASRRTLERLFVAETGLGIGRWRQRMRLLRALELLAAGEPVTTVATTVGYRTPSAFSAMFRAQLGASPSHYFRPAPEGGPSRVATG